MKDKSTDPVVRSPRRAPPRNRMTMALHDHLDRLTDTGASACSVIAQRAVEMAMSGDMDAIKFVTDRVDGKATQAVELSGPGGMPVPHMTREMTPAEAASAYSQMLRGVGGSLELEMDELEPPPETSEPTNVVSLNGSGSGKKRNGGSSPKKR